MANSGPALAGDLAHRLKVLSLTMHTLQRRATVLKDARAKLAAGWPPAVVIALVAEHEPEIAAEMALFTEETNGHTDDAA